MRYKYRKIDLNEILYENNTIIYITFDYLDFTATGGVNYGSLRSTLKNLLDGHLPTITIEDVKSI